MEGKYYAIWGHGHWVKVKGHIDTNLLPLSPDTSSQQISTKNLHSFRRYRAEGNLGFKVTGSRSQDQGHRIKVNSHIDTILSRNTPLSTDTSPMQISRKNLAALKSYRADTKLLTAARPPDFQDGHLEARK
jgi:hypothetical protein